MAQIPPDITREVFFRLPSEALLRARAVCREWCNIIGSKSFIHAHFIRSPTTLFIRNSSNTRLYSISADSLINYADDDQGNLEATPVSFSGVYDFPLLLCNGLILLQPQNPENNWVILNPITRKFRHLPRLEKLMRCAYVGFGYDSSSDDYKVVSIGEYPGRRYNDPYYTFVYSMKTDSWRRVADVDPDDISFCSDNGVFFNGFLHWKCKINHSLIRFDLATELYDEVPLSEIDRELVAYWNIGLLGGCLVVSLYYKEEKCLEGWVMKEEGWMKLFSIENTIRQVSILRPIAYWKRKGLVLLTDWCSKLLYLLDIEKNSLRWLTLEASQIKFLL